MYEKLSRETYSLQYSFIDKFQPFGIKNNLIQQINIQPFEENSADDNSNRNKMNQLSNFFEAELKNQNNEKLPKFSDNIWYIVFIYLETSELASFAFINRNFYSLIYAFFHFNYIKQFQSFPPNNLNALSSMISYIDNPRFENPKKSISNFIKCISMNYLGYGNLSKAKLILNSMYEALKPINSIFFPKEIEYTEMTKDKNIINIMMHNSLKNGLYGEKGISPLVLACQENLIEVVQFLIQNGLEFNPNLKNHDGFNCGQLIIINNNIELLKYFVENVDLNLYESDYTSSLICCSAARDDSEIAQFLLNYYSDRKLSFSLPGILASGSIAAEKNNYKFLNTLIINQIEQNSIVYKDMTPLMIICKNNFHSSFRSLIRSKTLNINKINNRGKTAFYYAAKYVK